MTNSLLKVTILQCFSLNVFGFCVPGWKWITIILNRLWKYFTPLKSKTMETNMGVFMYLHQRWRPQSGYNWLFVLLAPPTMERQLIMLARLQKNSTKNTPVHSPMSKESLSGGLWKSKKELFQVTLEKTFRKKEEKRWLPLRITLQIKIQNNIWLIWKRRTKRTGG